MNRIDIHKAPGKDHPIPIELPVIRNIHPCPEQFPLLTDRHITGSLT